MLSIIVRDPLLSTSASSKAARINERASASARWDNALDGFRDPIVPSSSSEASASTVSSSSLMPPFLFLVVLVFFLFSPFRAPTSMPTRRQMSSAPRMSSSRVSSPSPSTSHFCNARAHTLARLETRGLRRASPNSIFKYVTVFMTIPANRPSAYAKMTMPGMVATVMASLLSNATGAYDPYPTAVSTVNAKNKLPLRSQCVAGSICSSCVWYIW
mmetsp:Transcript_14349/g.60459  ORF Transcript_14349/g.60459 Transcript_14349/m.60459 type:complete len:215 (-) Transcript_14349:564-1208(-)